MENIKNSYVDEENFRTYDKSTIQEMTEVAIKVTEMQDDHSRKI